MEQLVTSPGGAFVGKPPDLITRSAPTPVPVAAPKGFVKSISGVASQLPRSAYENADQKAARVTREQFLENQRLFYPVEDALVGRAQADPEVEAARAAALADRGFARGQGTFERSLRGQGAVLTPEQRRSLNRKRGFLKSVAVGDAANRTRRAVKTRNEELVGDLVGFSRGIQRTAKQGIDDAASFEAARVAEGQALRQKYKNNQLSALGTAAGFAMTGNPWLAGAAAIGSFL